MDDWNPRANEIFAHALEIVSPKERLAFLDDSCGGDKALRAAVTRLLESHEKAGSFLEQPALDSAAEINRTVDIDPRTMEAGLAATFTSDTALVIGDAGHSVLKSIGKTLTRVPHVTLRGDEEKSPSSEAKSDTGSRYQLEGEIARGGMGAILKGRDADLGRDLAIKVLLDSHKDNPDAVARFVEEAQIGGQLQHPGIVPVHELGQFSDQRPFFSMKLVQGETLGTMLANRKEPSDDRPKFLGIFEQICQTMAYAHSRGVIHRDLKPANVMVGAFGEVQVMDWGLAKVLGDTGVADTPQADKRPQDTDVVQTRRSGDSDVPETASSQTRMGSVMGTPAYMPPEQALGEVDRLDERADVFGLGAVLCEILTGQPPYVGDDGSEVYRRAAQAQLDDCFTWLDTCGVEQELVDLAKDSLKADPEDRLRDAGELARRMTKYLNGVQERLKRAELANAKAQARRKLYVAIAGLLLLVAVGSVITAARFRRLAASEAREAQRANVMRLAAQSQSIQDKLPVQSVLLAMEAVELARATDLWPMPIAHETLLRTISSLGGVPLLSREKRINGLPISATDRLVKVARDDAVRVWDLTAEDPAAASHELELGPSISSPSISPDGRWIVAEAGGAVKVWRLNAEGDGITARIDLPTDGENHAYRISQDSKWIVTVSDGVTRLWNLAVEDPAAAPVALGTYEAVWQAPAISPNSRWVATADRSETRLWDIESTDPASTKQVFKKSTREYQPVTISPDNRWLVTGSKDGTRLYDLTAEDVVASERVLPGEDIWAVAVNLDGHWLLTGGRDARLFDLSSPDVAASAIILKGHGDRVNKVAISPNSRWLVTGSGDNTARIWDLESVELTELPILKDNDGKTARLWHADVVPGSSRVLRGHEEGVWALSITSDSRRLLTGSWDGTIRMWNLDSEDSGSSMILRGHKDQIMSVAVSPDGHWIATGSDDTTVRLWDLRADSPAAQSIILEGHQDSVRSLAISPDSRWLVAASGAYPFEPAPTATEARIWDLTAKDPSESPRILRGHGGAVTSVRIGPNSRLVVTLCEDNTARVWELSSDPAHEPRVLRGHTDTITAVALSLDHNSVVTGSADGTVLQWNLTAEDPVTPQTLLRQDDRIRAITLRTGGQQVVTGDDKKPTRIWNLNSPKVPSFRELPDGYLHNWWTPVPISSDGHWLGTTQRNTAAVWDLSSAADPISSQFVTHVHDAMVHVPIFSPVRGWFATAGEDGTARISNLLADNPTSTTLVLRGHEGYVTSIAISPDNRWVVTGSWDNTARLWELNIQTLMERARKLVGRELTDRERERYGVSARE